MPGLLIKHKIWIGFSFLLILLLINAGISVYNLNSTRLTMNAVIGKSQPLVLAAHKFNEYLAQASSALGNFLLTKNDKQRQNYQNALYEAQLELDLIANMEKVKQSGDLSSAVSGLQSQFQLFQQYEKKMLILAESSLENETALSYASESINPISNTILSSLTTMISAETEEDVSDERRDWLNIQHEIRYNFSKMMNAVRLYLAAPTQRTRENLLVSHEFMLNLMNKIDQFEELYNFEQEDGVSILKQNIQLYNKNMQVMIEKNESKKRRMDVYLVNEEITPLLKKMQQDIDSLVYEETTIMSRSSEGLLDGLNTSLKVQITLAMVGLILGGLVAFVISRMVTIPLNNTVTALQEAALGDGDLTRRLEINSKDELGSLAQAFNQFSIKLQSLMQGVSNCSSQLIGSAEQMNQVVSSTQSDIQNQNDQIKQIASAIESMVEKIQNVAGHTGQAATLAEQTSQNSKEGKDIVNKSLQSSGELARNVDQASEVINQLETDVESISGVLDVIRGVAEQTNLLALNAAIEAARAGEQGRGFAVVADEVRTLASRTQESTEEIQNMIQRLQSGSQQAVEAMGNGKSKANTGLDQARLSGDSLEKISIAVESMLSMNKEIARATEHQGQTASQVSSNVAVINQLSSQTAQGSSVMADTARQVNELAVQLQGLMRQFKV